MARKSRKKTPIANPLHDRVILKILDVDDVSEGGIILPSAAKDKSTRGEVVAVGPGRSYVAAGGGIQIEKMGVEVGDIVVFGVYTGVDLKIENQKLRVISESEILAVMP